MCMRRGKLNIFQNIRGQAWSIQDIVDNLSYCVLALETRYLFVLFHMKWRHKDPIHCEDANYRSLSTREDTLTSRCCLASSGRGRGRGRGRREQIETFKVLSWRKCSLITVWQTSHQLPRYWREQAWDIELATDLREYITATEKLGHRHEDLDVLIVCC